MSAATGRPSGAVAVCGRLLRGLTLLAPLGFVAVWLGAAIPRAVYPFDLEWLEGQALVSAQRVLAGQPLYGMPDIDYAPFMYTPMYYWVGAGAAAWLGPGFAPLRLVSIVSTLVALGAIAWIVRTATGRWRSGWIACGFFAATYPIGGAWFEVARVDMLFLALALLGVAALQRPTLLRTTLAATLFGCAFLTKQTALPVCLPLFAYLLLVRPARGWLFAAVIAGIVAGSTALGDAVSDGWYSRFVFDLARGSFTPVGETVVSYWTRDLIASLPVLSLAWGIFCVRTLWCRGRWPWGALQRWKDRPGGDGMILAATAAMLVACWASRVHAGGFDNVLIPAFAALAIGGSIEADRWLDRAATAPRAPSTPAGLAGALGVPALLLGQFALLLYDPIPLIPTEERIAAGWNLVRTVERSPGEVYVPAHPVIPILAGKKPFVHIGAWVWLDWGDDEEVEGELFQRLDEAFAARRFSMVICEELDMRGAGARLTGGEGGRLRDRLAAPWCSRFPALEREYVVTARTRVEPDALWTFSGMRTRPDTVLRPRPDPLR